MLRIFAKIMFTFVAVGAVSCGSYQRSVALNQVCGEPDKGAVRVEGYFRLPEVSDWIPNERSGEGEYRLLFVEKLTGGGSFITAAISGTGSHEPNRIDALPISYTYNDVRINTNSGKTVSAREKLSITGRVMRDSRPCILQVDKIETAPE